MSEQEDDFDKIVEYCVGKYGKTSRCAHKIAELVPVALWLGYTSARLDDMLSADGSYLTNDQRKILDDGKGAMYQTLAELINAGVEIHKIKEG